MDFVVPHEVTYNFDGRATVAEAARSLIAQDKLFREALQILEVCFPDLDIESVTVNLREVVQESPMRHRIEGYIVAAFSPALTEDMPKDILQALFGLDVPDHWDGIVSILILVISLWGAEKLVQKIKQSKKDGERREAEEEERSLAGERRRLTREAAARASVTEDHMAEAITETLLKHPSSVTKSAMDFLIPAKRHKASAITLPGGTEISQAAIQAVPSDVDVAQYQPPTETTPMENVRVTFRAHDRDRANHWAATISEVSPDRKPLHLAPDIRPEELFTRDQVMADVLVTSVLDRDGDYVPSVYFLSKVYDDESEQDADG